MALGKYVWVIGASQGIGKIMAQYLARRKINVAISARRETVLHEVNEILRGQDHIVAPLDVRESFIVRGALDKILTKWPRVDSVIYTAGVGTPKSFDKLTALEINEAFATNVTGILNVVSALLPVFRHNGGGRLVVGNAFFHDIPLPKLSFLGGSKAARYYTTKALQKELAPEGINVTNFEIGPLSGDTLQKFPFRVPKIGDLREEVEEVVDELITKDTPYIRAPKKFFRWKALNRMFWGRRRIERVFEGK